MFLNFFVFCSLLRRLAEFVCLPNLRVLSIFKSFLIGRLVASFSPILRCPCTIYLPSALLSDPIVRRPFCWRVCGWMIDLLFLILAQLLRVLRLRFGRSNRSPAAWRARESSRPCRCRRGTGPPCTTRISSSPAPSTVRRGAKSVNPAAIAQPRD